MSNGRVTTQLVIQGRNDSAQAFNEVQGDLKRLNSTLESTGKRIAGALSFGLLAGAIKGVAQTADAYQLMNARLKLATSSQQEFNTAQTELQRVALATGSPVSSLVDLYGRISRPLKEAGKAQRDILGVTEAVAISFRVSGASAVEAEQGVVQFAQALGSGALRGDEFNSVAEQAPRLMQALADGIGQPVSALKALASEGKLTAEVVTKALIGQLPKLQSELEGFGDTVGKEITAIGDTLERGFGNAATGPLIEALKELREALNDPQMQQNLTTLASALVRLAQGAVKTGAAAAGVGDDLGYMAAKLAGGVTELDRANKEIAVLEASAGDNFGMLDLYMTDEAIEEKLQAFKDYREQLIEQATGMNAEMRKKAEEQAEFEKRVDDARHQASLKAEQAYVTSMRNIRDQRVKDLGDEIKELERKEKAALTTVEGFKAKRLEVEKRYNDAIRSFRQGNRETDFGTVSSLQMEARSALRAGDAETAKARAQEALKALQEMAAAGKNTYGFDGIAKQLKGIENAALDLEQSKADAKVAEIREQVVSLRDEMAKLQNLSITLNLDDAEIEKVKKQLADLSSSPIFIPVKLGQPEGLSAIGLQQPNVSFPTGGYATGTRSAAPGIRWVGERGPELMAFGGGEAVLNSLASLNLANRLSGLSAPGLPAGMESAAAASPGGRNLGRVTLDLGGQQLDFMAEQSTFEEVLHLQALKKGRPVRR
ncbi:tape measure protein [Metapseudomonas otitidis]|uniref:tape measure protein n=1 Tax=Metapseudomonas otitidis TaxID=319939 RepID=UPI00209B1F02|nr:tape measure protein [Pseudomonas otitidis]MCO7558059.1 tape measure protein [Pseudomonas otitidis]